jgi:hypothetical protein
MPGQSSCLKDDTLKMAQIEKGERVSIYIKQQQDKIWVTKAQQDLLGKVANYNWLLVSKA